MSTRDEKIGAVEDELLSVRAELKRLSDRMGRLSANSRDSRPKTDSVHRSWMMSSSNSRMS